MLPPGWLYIQSSSVRKAGAAGTLRVFPALGARVGQANAPLMAKIVTSNMAAPLVINPKSNGVANHIRLVGIEITTTSQALAELNTKPWPTNGQSPVPVDLMGTDHIAIDRCYIHGSDTEDVDHAVIARKKQTACSGRDRPER